jgi:hypothetical protein
MRKDDFVARMSATISGMTVPGCRGLAAAHPSYKV